MSDLLQRAIDLERLSAIVLGALTRAESIKGEGEACNVGSTIYRHIEEISRIVGYAPFSPEALAHWEWQYKQEPHRWTMPEPSNAKPSGDLSVLAPRAWAVMEQWRNEEHTAVRGSKELRRALDASGLSGEARRLLKEAVTTQEKYAAMCASNKMMAENIVQEVLGCGLDAIETARREYAAKAEKQAATDAGE